MAVPSGRSGAAMGDAVLAKHGDRGRATLRLGGVRAGWELSAPGEFSAFCRLSDALDLEADPADLRGWWIAWEHPDIGPWGGVVSDVALRDSGVLEIAGQGWLSLLEKRLTRRRDTTITAPAGAIANRIVRQAGSGAPTGIAGVDCEAWGDFVSWRDDGGEVLPALSRLARMSDQEYVVGPADRVFYWRRAYGTDRRRSVQLFAGIHVTSWRPAWSLAPVVTEVVLTPSDRSRFATAPAVSGYDADAYARFGSRQVRAPIRGRVARSSARAVADRQAERLARQGAVLDFEVADVDGCRSRFGLGDTITVVLPEIDRALAVRCLALTWDQESDLLRVSGEIA